MTAFITSELRNSIRFLERIYCHDELRLHQMPLGERIFVNQHLSHTTLSTTIFHTSLSTTICHTQLCQPPSFTHIFVTHCHTHTPHLERHLSHASLSHIFVNHHLCHTPSVTLAPVGGVAATKGAQLSCAEGSLQDGLGFKTHWFRLPLDVFP